MGKSCATTSLTSTIESVGVIMGGFFGYDNSHESHHRHFMGSVEFESYDAIVKRFEDELAGMWRKEDE